MGKDKSKQMVRAGVPAAPFRCEAGVGTPAASSGEAACQTDIAGLAAVPHLSLCAECEEWRSLQTFFWQDERARLQDQVRRTSDAFDAAKTRPLTDRVHELESAVTYYDGILSEEFIPDVPRSADAVRSRRKLQMSELGLRDRLQLLSNLQAETEVLADQLVGERRIRTQAETLAREIFQEKERLLMEIGSLRRGLEAAAAEKSDLEHELTTVKQFLVKERARWDEEKYALTQTWEAQVRLFQNELRQVGGSSSNSGFQRDGKNIKSQRWRT